MATYCGKWNWPVGPLILFDSMSLRYNVAISELDPEIVIDEKNILSLTHWFRSVRKCTLLFLRSKFEGVLFKRVFAGDDGKNLVIGKNRFPSNWCYSWNSTINQLVVAGKKLKADSKGTLSNLGLKTKSTNFTRAGTNGFNQFFLCRESKSKFKEI